MQDLNGYMRDFMTPMHLVDDKLYLGGLMGARDRATLMNNRISAIVQALASNSDVNRHPGIDYYCIEIEDSELADISQHFEGALTFILNSHREGKNVFVHCAAGISRSTSIVSAYLMAKYNKPYEEIIEYIRQKRSCAAPNSGFEDQLMAIDIQGLRNKIGFQ